MPSRLLIVCLLLTSLGLSGCVFGGGDPATETLIVNDSDFPVRLQLVLDRGQWSAGFEDGEYEDWLAERDAEWFLAEVAPFVESDAGATLIEHDVGTFTGVFQLDPGAMLVVNSSLGTGPFLDLTEIVVSNNSTWRPTNTFTGSERIERLFVEGDENIWEFEISSVGLDPSTADIEISAG